MPRATSRISLMISDVDGTLVTKEKALTADALEAVRSLRAAGILFTIVSSRPPRGLGKLLPALDLDLPFGGFNGGAVLDPKTLAVLERQSLSQAAARETLDFFAARGVSAWVFSGVEWLLLDPDGPYVEHERETLGFEPRTVDAFDDAALAEVGKIVGASEDLAGLAQLEAELQGRLEGTASVLRSQRYYLDVTHPDATKGNFLRALSRRLSIPAAEIAVIGDMANDVSMFREAGLSIAMGNAAEAVREAADVVTASNMEEGFARAVESFVLPRAAARSTSPAGAA